MSKKTSNIKHDASICRILLIDINNPPDLTAEEFLSYINEGFIPVVSEKPQNDPGALYEFANWSVNHYGVVGFSGYTISFLPEDYDGEK